MKDGEADEGKRQTRNRKTVYEQCHEQRRKQRR